MFTHVRGCRWVSLLGAAMSMMYSLIAFIASAAHGAKGVSYSDREGSRADKLFGILNSLGGITFAFGGQIVLIEIQVR